MIIESLIPRKDKQEWLGEDVNNAVAMLLKESNANFDDLIKNLENNTELYQLVQRIILDGETISYVRTNNIISLGTIYGIFKQKDGRCAMHNKIFELKIYDHIMMKTLREKKN